MNDLKVIPHPEMGDGYYSIGNVLYYHGANFDPTDHRVVMPDVCKNLGWVWSREQGIAYERYLDEVTAGYKRAYAKRTPEQLAEEAYEIEAAFGKGVRVINVITGEERTT